MAMVRMTPTQITNWFEKNSANMEIPEAFYGSEVNSYRADRTGMFHKEWDDAELKVLYAAPWTYKDFTGNQTFPLLYKLTNDWERDSSARPFIAERSHMPSNHKDMKHFTKHGIPIFGLESRRPMAEFDVVCFSLGYPPFLANVVHQLKMSGIPFRWRDREDMKEPYPLIMAGGSLFGSPEPWTPLVDVVFIGEAEDEPDHPGLMAVYEDIALAINPTARYTEDGMSIVINTTAIEDEQAIPVNYYSAEGRTEFLHFLARKYDFLYVPRFITPVYDDKKHITHFNYSYDDIPKLIKKRHVKDLNAVPCLDAPPIPFFDPSMGLGEIELARGCNAGNCTFCAVGFRYRPYRERSIEYMVKNLKENIKNTGSTVAFPCAFEFTGYTKKKQLVKRILTEVSDSVDTQSQRIDNMAMDANFALLAGEGGMDQLAVGVEGNSERIRTYVNKGATEELILKACENALKAGFRKLKLYMIADLPPETQEDTDSIVELCSKIVEMRDSIGSTAQIKASWTPLLIEAWTPLQWSAPTIHERKLQGIFQKLKDIGVDFSLGKKTEPNYSYSTQVAHMCDRIAAEALVDTYDELNAIYIGAVNRNVKDTLEKNLRARGVDGYNHYFNDKPKDFIFPWDIIDMGVTKEYMWRLNELANKVIEDTDKGGDPRGDRKDGFLMDKCFDGCTTCGMCGPTEIKEMRAVYKGREGDDEVDLGKITIMDEKSIVQKVRLQIYVDPYYRYVQNDYWKALIRRAAWQFDIPVTKRTVRFASDEVKFKNWIAGTDYVEFGLLSKYVHNKKEAATLVEQMNSELEHFGVKVLAAETMSPKIDSLRRHGEYSLYEITTDRDLQVVTNAMKRWNESDYIKMVLKEDNYRAGMVREEVNAKDYIKDIWAVKDGTTIKIKMFIKGKASPFDIYSALLEARSNEAYAQIAVKIDAFVTFDENQADFFRPICDTCGCAIPVNFLDKAIDYDNCPRCADELAGRFLC